MSAGVAIQRDSGISRKHEIRFAVIVVVATGDPLAETQRWMKLLEVELVAEFQAEIPAHELRE